MKVYELKIGEHHNCKPFRYIIREDGCFESISHKNKDMHGYQCVKYYGRRMKAHKLFYEMFVKEIDNEILIHTCDNPSCFNPLHMYPATVGESIMHMRSKRGKGKCES